MKIIIIFLIAILINCTAFAQTHKIASYVIGSGGGIIQNSSNVVKSTTGQPAIGLLSNTSNFAMFGFWYLLPNEVIQQISLTTGWNMVSLYVEPKNISMESVWANIVNKVLIVKNNQGAVYIPSYNINNIGNWNKIEGYLVYMTSAETLEVKGKKIKPSTTVINLNTGWAIIPYLRSSNMTPALSLKTLTDEDALLIAKDLLGNAFIPQYNIDNLGNLIPGKAYKIYISKNGSQLIYPD